MGEGLENSREDQDDSAAKDGSELEDTREFTPEEKAELGLFIENLGASTVELSAPSRTGGKMELWSANGVVAAGVVLERDQSGQPTIWESYGGSLWGADRHGQPYKIRDKWG